MASILFLEEKACRQPCRSANHGLLLGWNWGCRHPPFVREYVVVTLNRLVVITVIVIIERTFQCFHLGQSKHGEGWTKCILSTLDLTPQNDNVFRAKLEISKVIWCCVLTQDLF